jgi:hypothetical protein
VCVAAVAAPRILPHWPTQVRVSRRPLNAREREEGEVGVVTVSPTTNEITLNTSLKRNKTYTFDKVGGASVFCVANSPVPIPILATTWCLMMDTGLTVVYAVGFTSCL